MLLIDPFRHAVGVVHTKVKPDVITHDHFDHDAVPKIPLPYGAKDADVRSPSAKEGAGDDQKQQGRRAPVVPAPFPIVPA